MRGVNNLLRGQPLVRNARSKTEGVKVRETRKIWHGVKHSCTNPRHPGYKNYGAIGIRLHSSWYDFDRFLADMGPRPSNRHTLIRLDPTRGYEPGNCEWGARTQTKRTAAQHRREHFIVKGRFDWERWRRAGSPEFSDSD